MACPDSAYFAQYSNCSVACIRNQDPLFSNAERESLSGIKKRSKFLSGENRFLYGEERDGDSADKNPFLA